ncbi:MAG TPA: AMP-binding protein [Solirubrobacterales bacterium]|jgi:fatty-acyl-CoA synthase|nr:AMP-binding protein [Solirubrobacterales bacterium]
MSRLTDNVQRGLELARTVANTRIVGPVHPKVLLEINRAMRKWGPTPGTAYAIGTARTPDRPAIVDERGELTYRDVHERTNQLANALLEEGVTHNSRVAILCRNHRGFIEAFVATLKTGSDALLMNTAFAGPQLTSVLEDQNADAVIMDEEYYELLKDGLTGRKAFIAWTDSDQPPLKTLDDLRRGQSTLEPKKPQSHGRTIILTSGTTGKPKGAARSEPKGISGLLSVVSIMPYRYGDRILVAAPLFHTWGFANFSANLTFNGTVILRRRFDPEDALKTIEREQATMMSVVPVMLQRMLDLPEEVRRRYSTKSLRMVNASGSALPGELATEFMDEFGDVLYNLYGSTEVAWATAAAPADMRAAPGTAGRVPTGTVLKILDNDRKELPTGETGQIFVKHDMVFEGYTGGEATNAFGDMVGTGDLGHLDENGRLFIDGRIDEMIVSGGENVYPIEVEDVIARHEAVRETAVIGVEDEKFGERLKAFVVPSNGHDISEKDLKAYVKSNLAGYKVPREIVFLDELPRNATGKVLKRELREL